MARRLRVLVGYQVDAAYRLAQHGIVREVIARLDPDRFDVTAFYDHEPDPRLRSRPHTRLVALPSRGKSLVRARWLARGFDRCWYLAPEPSTDWYLRTRPWSNRAVTSVESQPWTGVFDGRVDASVLRTAELLIARSRRLTAVNEEVADGLRRHRGREAVVVPVGVDTDRFHPRPDGIAAANGERRPTVLYVGALQPWKRPDLLLDAASRIDADFRLVGDGPLRSRLEARVREQGLSNVSLAGTLDGDGLAEAYRAADVFCFPSEWEGMPKVLLEAAASGLPSVVCGEYEASSVEDGVTGFRTRTTEQMEAALRRALDDPALRASMGDRARQGSLAYGWDAVAERWAAVLTEPLPAVRR